MTASLIVKHYAQTRRRNKTISNQEQKTPL